MEDLDEFLRKLVHGERVERHSHDIPGYVIQDLENKDWLDRDERGFLVAGEKLRLQYGLSDE